MNITICIKPNYVSQKLLVRFQPTYRNSEYDLCTQSGAENNRAIPAVKYA